MKDLDHCEGCGGYLGGTAMTLKTSAGSCRVHGFECGMRWLDVQYVDLKASVRGSVQVPVLPVDEESEQRVEELLRRVQERKIELKKE